MKKLALSIALACLVMTAAACTDDDDSDVSADDGGGAAVTTTTAAELTGEPITIGVIGIEEAAGVAFPEMLDAVELGVSRINAEGGIDGRPIEVERCNDGFDPAQAADCFRTMAEDEDVVALVGGGSAFTDMNAELIDETALPWIGSPGATPTEGTNPHFVPAALQAETEFRGLGIAAGADGGTTANLMRLSNPAADSQEAAIREGAESAGVTIENVVPIELTAVDLTAAAADLTEGDPDAVILGGQENQIQQAIRLLKGSGYDGRIVVPLAQTTSEFAEALGPDGDGVVGVGFLAPIVAPEADAPGLEQLRQDVEANDPDMRLNGYTTNSYLAALLFARAAEDAVAAGGEVTRESVLEAAQAITDFDSLGITAESIDFTADPPIEAVPNLKQTSFVIVTAEGGEWTWDGEFTDAASA